MAGGGSGLGKDLVFRSLQDSMQLPTDPFVDITSYMIKKTSNPELSTKLALADSSTGEHLTFAQLHSYIRSIARGLRHCQGIGQNDVVLILSPNSVHFPAIFFAVISLGAIATTVNPVWTAREIAKQASDSRAHLIITVPELLDNVLNLRLPVVLIGGGSAVRKESISLLSELIIKSETEIGVEPPPPNVRIRQTDTAALLYSSGTTGLSKGVALTHRNFIASALQINMDSEALNERDLAFYCVIPMFHVYGLSVIVFGQLQRGNTIVTTPKFDFVQMLEAIQKYRITNLPLVPPIIICLAKLDIVSKYDLSSVQDLTSGAAPIGKEVMEEVYNRLHIPNVRQGYGMTETSGIISLVHLNSGQGIIGSSGPLVSDMEAVIVDPITRERLSTNKQGELWVRGPNVMKGYFNNPSATSETLDNDGWLRTGDLVLIDDIGHLHVMDRLKELIKYKGLQVPPAELEALLLTHPQILDAAVVPMPDAEAGEVPLAYVVKKPSSSLSEYEVIKFIASQVASYKKVRQVRFTKAIPKSSAGKILRRELIQTAVSKL